MDYVWPMTEAAAEIEKVISTLHVNPMDEMKKDLYALNGEAILDNDGKFALEPPGALSPMLRPAASLSPLLLRPLEVQEHQDMVHYNKMKLS